jgi:diguanylate cyclase (GGDEF)-like protein
MRVLLAGLVAYLAARLHLARRQATVDARTGLLTATAWLSAAARLPRSSPDAAVLMIDIDRFKQVNDTRGHLAGDAVIASVARCLRTNLRRNDLVCRFGGDEFAALLAGVSTEQAVAAAQRLCAAVAVESAVTVSVGVASSSAEVPIRALLSNADAALYLAKARGGDTVVASGDEGRHAARADVDA